VVKVNAFKRLLERQKRLLQPKIDNFKEGRKQLQNTFLRIHEASKDETLKDASEQISS